VQMAAPFGRVGLHATCPTSHNSNALITTGTCHKLRLRYKWSKRGL
jgi:hypothetical protein